MYGGTFLLFFINWLNSLHLTHHVSHTTLCSSHWWHHNCLNKVLTKPPFGLQGCPKCGLRIWHHEWERDIKRLERRWAAKQARDRELNEVADSFGGLGEEFIVRRKKKNSDDEGDSSEEEDPDDVDAKASATLFEKW